MREQGDTPVQGDTGGYAPTPAREEVCAIYNVWDDEGDVDEWDYDPNDALMHYHVAVSEFQRPIYVTRYKEINGDVNTRDDFVRLTLEELEEDTRTYEMPVIDD